MTNLLIDNGINAGHHVAGIRFEALGWKTDWTVGTAPAHGVIALNSFGRHSFVECSTADEAEATVARYLARGFEAAEIATRTPCSKFIPAL